LIAVEEFLGLVASDALMEIIVDEANRSSPAGSQAFGKFHRVISARRYCDGILVRVGGVAIDSGDLAKLVHEFIGSSHGARQGPANADVEFARSFLAEAWIKRDNLDDLHGFDIELIRNPVDRLGADVSEAMLDFVKKRKDGGAFLIFWILRDAFIRLFFEPLCDGKAREEFFARGLC